MLIILFIHRELFKRSLCHLNISWIKHFTYRYSSIWETVLCSSAVKLQTHDCFTTTMRQVKHLSLWGNFWLNIVTQRFPHPPYSPDFAPCDFFSFPKLKTHLKNIILGQLKTSKQLRRGLWITSQVKTFSTAMKSGSNAGIAVFDHKEPILKGINWIACMFNKNF